MKLSVALELTAGLNIEHSADYHKKLAGLWGCSLEQLPDVSAVQLDGAGIYDTYASIPPRMLAQREKYHIPDDVAAQGVAFVTVILGAMYAYGWPTQWAVEYFASIGM